MPLPIIAYIVFAFVMASIAAYRFLSRQRRAVDSCERTYQRLRKRRSRLVQQREIQGKVRKGLAERPALFGAE